jgi:hypothetical protein
MKIWNEFKEVFRTVIFGCLLGLLAAGGVYTATLIDMSQIRGGGSLNPSSLNNIIFVDGLTYSQSPDLGVGIRAAYAALPLRNGYPSGWIIIPAGIYNLSTTVTISSPYVTVQGAGVGATFINGLVNGDNFRLNTSPFSTVPGAQLSDLTILGTSAANGVGVHGGDEQNLKLRRLFISGFTGASGICMWLDNVTNYTERIDMQDDVYGNCTTVLKYTNTSGTTSFGYGNYRNVMIQPNTNQQGVWIAATGGQNINLYHSFINWYIENWSGTGPNNYLRADTGTLLVDNLYDIAIEDQASIGGTALNLGNNITVSGGGVITSYCGTHTDTIGTGITLTVRDMTTCSNTSPGFLGIGSTSSIFQNPIPATVGTPQPAPPIKFLGYCWGGAGASTLDTLLLTPTIGAGLNGNSGLVLTDSGCTGTHYLQVPQLTLINAAQTGSAGITYAGGAAFPGFTFNNSTTGQIATSPNLLISHTAPTIAGAGCGGTVAAITAPNGTGSFEVFTGTNPLTACTITMPAATTSWTCEANTVSATTTTNYVVKQTGAISTTSVVLTLYSDAAVATNYQGSDTLRVKCVAN